MSDGGTINIVILLSSTTNSTTIVGVVPLPLLLVLYLKSVVVVW